MKKILILLCILSLVFTTVFPVYGEQPVEDVTETVEIYDAEAELLNAVIGEVSFSGDTVSRGQFVDAVARIRKINYGTPTEGMFSDVDERSTYAKSIYGAYAAGLISGQDTFEPDRAIDYNEAMKIAVCALGYEVNAQLKGGYPIGYLVVASDLKLMQSFTQSTGALTVPNAYRLLYNMLNAEVLEQTSFGQKPSYETLGNSLLNVMYDIYELEGIVSGTVYNSLGDESGYLPEGVLEIEGTRFLYDGEQSKDMLGLKYNAYIKRTDELMHDTVVSLVPLYKEELVIDLYDYTRKDDTTLWYFPDSEIREQHVDLNKNLYVIYNGRRVIDSVDDYFTAGNGTLRLIDNDGDGAYDVAFIEKYEYVVVRAADVVNQYIRDVNDQNSTIDLSDSKCIFVIEDANGEPCELIDINEEDVLKVQRSLDGLLNYISKIDVSETITGIVSSKENDLIYINNETYRYSDYFKDNYYDNLIVGKEYTFTLDGNSLIMAELVDTGMMYGYVIDIAKDKSLDMTYLVKIFGSDNKMHIITVPERVKIDGARLSAADLYSKLKPDDQMQKQLVKYRVNSNDEMAAIDFSTKTLPEKLGDVSDADNNMVEYTFPVSIFKYRNSGTFATYFHSRNAFVFVIPKGDDAKDEDYLVTSQSMFWNGSDYALRVFDLDETGGAGALIYEGSLAQRGVFAERYPGVLQSVSTALDEDNEEVYLLDIWFSGQIQRFVMPKTMNIVKKSIAGAEPVNSTHPLLSSGDIVRFEADSNNEIIYLAVDFDARKKAFTPNMNDFNLLVGRYPMYYEGTAYNCVGDFISLSHVYEGGAYNYSIPNLRFISLGSAPIVEYDAERCVIRPVQARDIKTYVSDGKDAHYMVVAQRDFISTLIVLYEFEEGRK